MHTTSSSGQQSSPNRLTVDLDAVRHNLGVVRQYVGDQKRVIAVVKADGYGLGAVPISRALAAAGIEYLAVSRLGEAIELRDAGITSPILMLGALAEEEISAALSHDLTMTLVSLSFAERLHRMAMEAQKVIRVHCNIDTGMCRLGLDPDSAADQLGQLVRFSTIDIEGIYTHLVQAHIEKDPFTLSQIKRFHSTLKQIDKLGIPYEITHAANSADRRPAGPVPTRSGAATQALPGQGDRGRGACQTAPTVVGKGPTIAAKGPRSLASSMLASIASPVNLIFMPFSQGLTQAKKPGFGKVSSFNY